MRSSLFPPKPNRKVTSTPFRAWISSLVICWWCWSAGTIHLFLSCFISSDWHLLDCSIPGTVLWGLLWDHRQQPTAPSCTHIWTLCGNNRTRFYFQSFQNRQTNDTRQPHNDLVTPLAPDSPPQQLQPLSLLHCLPDKIYQDICFLNCFHVHSTQPTIHSCCLECFPKSPI